MNIRKRVYFGLIPLLFLLAGCTSTATTNDAEPPSVKDSASTPEATSTPVEPLTQDEFLVSMWKIPYYSAAGIWDEERLEEHATTTCDIITSNPESAAADLINDGYAGRDITKEDATTAIALMVGYRCPDLMEFVPATINRP